jgi:hypothetical protein
LLRTRQFSETDVFLDPDPISAHGIQHLAPPAICTFCGPDRLQEHMQSM